MIARTKAEEQATKANDIVVSTGLIPDGTVLATRLVSDDRVVRIVPSSTYPPAEAPDIFWRQEVKHGNG